MLRIDDIEQSPFALRQVDTEDLMFIHLKDSIRSVGLITPITVRKAKFANNTYKIVCGVQKYEVVSGMHRLEACRQLGWNVIEAIVLDLTDEQFETNQIISSKCFAPVKPYQYTQSLLRILARYPILNLDDLCEKLFVEPGFIIKRLGLEGLSKRCLAKVYTKEMCLANAYELAKLRPTSEQENLLNDALTNSPIEFACKAKDRIKFIRNNIRELRNKKSMSREYLDGKQVRDFLTKIPRNHIFTVIFEKKDGTLRQMTGRRDVRAKLKGGKNSLKDCKHLQSLYDTGAEDYRCFDTNKVLLFRGEGYELKVRDFDPLKNRIYTALDSETKPKFDVSMACTGRTRG